MPGQAYPLPGQPYPPHGPVEEPRQRLHPLSPILKGSRALVVIIAGLSWQTLGRVGFGRFALLVVLCLLGYLAVAVISWYNTGYHVVGRELRIHEGLLWRRTRAIPLERLQAVEVVRPLLAQLTGLAELRLEVVGGGQTEAPLAYLTVADAATLRARLLALAGRAKPAPDAAAPDGTAPLPDGTPAGLPDPSAPPPGRLLHTVVNRDLLISQLLTPQTMFLPFGVAFVITQFAMDATWSFVAVASTLTATAGVILQPIRRVLSDWNFRLARDEVGLRVRHGLTETRSQTVPLHRIQAIGATWPLLWRGKRWLRLRLHVAGYAAPDGQGGGTQSDQLLPVGVLPTANHILADVLPGIALDALPMTPPPRRARWLNPLVQPKLGAGLANDVFSVRSGLLTRQMLVVPYARMQSVRVVRGPLQRLLGLATVYADTAGGPSAAAKDRDVAEAWWLAAELSDRARAARSTPADPPSPQPSI
ncbi:MULTISPECIES: PH domain-containing protein [unclassified Solwaraspora]|uniref:PH domain-containing protein n=1 Tax=unclassified Solwaraspora TaxID=2627926 RepID=UPI00248B32DE|nr:MULTISPECIES: PH domain-containing protein [unclassified Solwaraspora]WBC23611.1 PH domain-containing protein [Solwaraspora sp. WMMA2080]WJK37702.1 PH domain-containing protein [Solwaraspora sp. WMMA2065]